MVLAFLESVSVDGHADVGSPPSIVVRHCEGGTTEAICLMANREIASSQPSADAKFVPRNDVEYHITSPVPFLILTLMAYFMS